MKSHRFIAAVAAGLVTLGFAPSAAAGSPAPADPPTKTPIKHFVVLMQENHSFDNYFGTFPGADGIPAGTMKPASKGPSMPGKFTQRNAERGPVVIGVGGSKLHRPNRMRNLHGFGNAV